MFTLYLIAFPVLWVVVGIVVAYLLYDALSRVPERYRAAPPYFAWLTLIPVAGVAFYWILLPFKVPESFQRYFSDHPNETAKSQDCGKALGLACVILGVLCLIPILDIIASIPALIVLILYLRRVAAMAKLIPVQAPHQPVQPTSLKKCPYCAEFVQPEAVKCKHCGSPLPK
ncbi:MAG: zinc ribbon domain-containing protein [Candidatus Eisenbacteria bacterium]